MARLARDRFIAGVTLAYGVAASLWILLSDRLIESFADVSEIAWFATAKGLSFVLVTSALLFLGLRRVPAGEEAPVAPLLDTLIEKLPFKRGWGPRLAYLFALLLSLLVQGICLLLSSSSASLPLFALMLLPVILSAALGGLGPGLLATAVAGVGSEALLIESASDDALSMIRLGSLVIDGVLISALSERLRRVRFRAEADRQMLAVMLASIGDAVVATDRQQRVFFINREAQSLCGLSEESARGRSLDEVFPLRIDPKEDGEGAYSGLWLVPGGGEKIPVQSRTYPIRMEDGREIGQILVARDERLVLETQRLRKQDEMRFERLVKLAPQALCFVAADGRFLYGNDQFHALFGYPDTELSVVGSWWLRAYPDPAYREAAKQAWDEALAYAMQTGTAVGPVEQRIRCADGEDREVEVSAIPIDGGLMTSFYDLTERHRTEKALRESEEHLARAVEASGVGLWEFWPDTNQVHLSESFAAMLGYTLAELQPVSSDTWFALTLPDDAGKAHEIAMSHLSGDLPGVECEVRMRHKDGNLRWVLVRGKVSERMANGHPVRVSGTAIDETEHHLAAERIAELAYCDALTGLPNRLLLRDRVEQAISHGRRQKGHFVMAFLDLDVFKMVNDSLGHSAGDCLLRAVAERLRNFVRAEDTVARLGGDEFVVLFSETTAANAIRLLPQLLEDIASPYAIEGHNLTVSASIGVCEFPNDGTDYDALVRAADTAMYEAKAAGRNTFRFFSAEMNQAATARLELEESLRHALAHGELELHYPAQRNLVTGEVTGYEAQLNWHSPLLGDVPTEHFMPIAEATGLINEIGRWVLREACRQNQQWIEQGVSRVPVAVNLSAMQLRRGEIERDVSTALEEAGLAPELLELEITEALLADASEKTMQQLLSLKEMGIHLVVDDFGAGYSNISDLKRFPVDRIKICPSFVKDLSADPRHRDLAAAIVGAAAALQLDVLAEGVETPEQARELLAIGCQVGQDPTPERVGLST
ncbi:EAL and GGDEF domain-containing protein [Niveibacterium terrae]|uniref:sensor domain-containing protein n=1 Tax=Niveibacterium terrae TaxID=3373598 RepID=UPI003A90343A